MPRKDGSEEDEPIALIRPGRRNMLKWLGMGGTAALAGCLGGGGNDTTTNSQSTDTAKSGGTATSESESTSVATSSAPMTTGGTSMAGGTSMSGGTSMTGETSMAGETSMTGGTSAGTTGGGGTTGGAGGTTGTGTAPSDRKLSEYNTIASSPAHTLNWIYNTEDGAGALIALTMDGSWTFKSNGTSGTLDDEVFPLWLDVSTEDSKTYTMTVQDGLQWGGDYGQMTAEDWVYMLKNLHLADENWSGYPNYAPFTGSVKKTGDMTFEYTLQETDPAWTARAPGGGGMWGMYCVPKDLFSKYVKMNENGNGDKAAKQLQKDKELSQLSFTGNLGPYNQKSWDQGSKFVAARNDKYYMQSRDGVSAEWQNAPYYKTYTQQVVPEQSSRLQALQKGSTDVATIPPNQLSKFEKLDNVDVYTIKSPYLRIFTFNMRANGWLPFRDKNVRQAVMRAMNKPAFVNQVLRGNGQVTSTWQPQWSDWYDGSQVKQLGTEDTFSIKKARSQLSSALSDSEYDYSVDGKNVVDKDGNTVSLKVISQAGQPTETTMAGLIKQYLTQVGFKVAINKVPAETFINNYAYNSVPQDKVDQVPDDWPFPNPTEPGFNKGPRDISTSKKDYDIGLIYRFNAYPRAPGDSATFFQERGSINYYGYVPSDGVDIAGTLAKAGGTADQDKRKQLFAEVFGTISKEQPVGVLMTEDDRTGYSSDIVGPSEEFGAGWDSNTWYRQS